MRTWWVRPPVIWLCLGATKTGKSLPATWAPADVRSGCEHFYWSWPTPSTRWTATARTILCSDLWRCAIDAAGLSSAVAQSPVWHDRRQLSAAAILVSAEQLPPSESPPRCTIVAEALAPPRRTHAPNGAYTSRVLHASHAANRLEQKVSHIATTLPTGCNAEQ